MRSFILMSFALSGSGCYTYSYQERNGGDLARVPIDANDPESRVRWSTFWGLQGDNFAPTACGDGQHENGDPACTDQIPLCEKGAGRVTTSMEWYSALTMAVTLGVAMPHTVSVYCATNRSADDGEQPPIGP